jgi:hypothetical protein
LSLENRQASPSIATYASKYSRAIHYTSAYSCASVTASSVTAGPSTNTATTIQTIAFTISGCAIALPAVAVQLSTPGVLGDGNYCKLVVGETGSAIMACNMKDFSKATVFSLDAAQLM